MKRLLILTVATLAAAPGCCYLRDGRCNRGWSTYDEPYTMYDEGYQEGYDEGMVYQGGENPVYLPDQGAVIGPEMFVPGETIPAPGGQPLPGPAQS
jgi:hypothetical protein